jgi:hypothetical protein
MSESGTSFTRDFRIERAMIRPPISQRSPTPRRSYRKHHRTPGPRLYEAGIRGLRRPRKRLIRLRLTFSGSCFKCASRADRTVARTCAFILLRSSTASRALGSDCGDPSCRTGGRLGSFGKTDVLTRSADVDFRLNQRRGRGLFLCSKKHFTSSNACFWLRSANCTICT